MMRSVYVFDDNNTTLQDFRDAARELDCVDTLNCCNSEDQGLDVIRKFRRSAEEPIFVVDMNMDDDESGLRILAAIRKKDALRKAPVIIITSSPDQLTINKCYDQGANAYYQKKQAPDEFQQDVIALMKFWSTVQVHSRCNTKG